LDRERQRRSLALLLLLLPALLGCRRTDSAAGERYPLRGRVIEVVIEEGRITIDHEEIEGFMPAMRMPFPVRKEERGLLARAAPGDEVTATLVVPDSRYWLEDLVVVKKAAPGGPAAGRAVPVEAMTGDPLPDVTLVNQDGKTVRLSAYRGKALALTFIFTRCPLPEFCPMMMKNFASVHAELLADERLRERTRLLSVSFDTRHDTPPVLRAYGLPFQKTRPPFTHWQLAGGEEQAIRALGVALGLEFVEESRSFSHNLRTAVVDTEGRLFRLHRGNDWKPARLVADLREAVGAQDPGRGPR
jgi:protein SCO1/2